MTPASQNIERYKMRLRAMQAKNDKQLKRVLGYSTGNDGVMRRIGVTLERFRAWARLNPLEPVDIDCYLDGNVVDLTPEQTREVEATETTRERRNRELFETHNYSPVTAKQAIALANAGAVFAVALKAFIYTMPLAKGDTVKRLKHLDPDVLVGHLFGRHIMMETDG